MQASNLPACGCGSSYLGTVTVRFTDMGCPLWVAPGLVNPPVVTITLVFPLADGRGACNGISIVSTLLLIVHFIKQIFIGLDLTLFHV
jgi:hypothetical protein